MSKRKIDYGNGVIVDCDFTEAEHERRFQETLRRCCCQKPTFDLETGQPYEGKQLSKKELRSRGY